MKVVNHSTSLAVLLTLMSYLLLEALVMMQASVDVLLRVNSGQVSHDRIAARRWSRHSCRIDDRLSVTGEMKQNKSQHSWVSLHHCIS